MPRPRKQSPRPVGRPRAVVDEEKVRVLASVGCTTDEIAAALDVDARTLERNFAALIKKGREQGRMSLRRKRWQIAMTDGHKAQGTMLVWLSKQVLRESDRLEQEIRELPALVIEDEPA